jgi:hypothetical protein
VLDQDDRHPAGTQPAQQQGQLAALRAGQPRHRLVEQQQVGLQRERTGDLDQALAPERQVDGEPVGVRTQAEQLDQVAADRSSARSSARAGSTSEPLSSPARLRRCLPTMTLPSTVADPKICRFWKVRVAPARAMTCGLRPSTR